jgi:hypothetical protein
MAEIASTLQPLGIFSIQIFAYSNNAEVLRISDDIAAAVKSAGWKVAVGTNATGGHMVSNISFVVRKDAPTEVKAAAEALAAALRAAHIEANLSDRTMDTVRWPDMYVGEEILPHQIRALIGPK